MEEGGAVIDGSIIPDFSFPPSPFAVALLIYVWPIGLAKKSLLRLLRRISFFCLFDLEAVAGAMEVLQKKILELKSDCLC